ncbi:toxic anion resistance protein [Jeotgalicoccus huakuii]|uniref:toxic anion resistance protein n=1 Tax=Jeotgalicoccus TaxID=227979 RepID=UPI000420870E|nr:MULTISPECIES: toxic anion resistance protein [Jeotgalicoccus]MCK1976691.1 toxic anion resistance protein [Jeotgalicoccus huakuii]QQD85370.1 toxic anion resistance protein [Jeotgalicoccus sp. ATCC 8456]
MTEDNLKNELLKDPFKSINEPGEQDDFVLQKEVQPETNSQSNSVLTTFQDQFSEEDLKTIKDIKNKIQPLDNDALITYGANAQQAMSKFSHQMLNEVQSKDVGPIGDTLEDLMKKLKEIDPEELTNEKSNIFKRMFGKVKRSVNEMISKHQSIASQVDRISIQLEHAKEVLVKDVNMLDGLYNQNKDYFDAINIYIAAAELKKEELENEELPRLKKKANESNNQMDVQDVNDMMQYVNRLEKRIHDLKLSRQITLQSAPQIRMIQNINQTLAEKIQSSILTSIPLWKNQMAIALTLLRQESASKAQQEVTNTTNDLLTKNSEMLRQNSLRTATENERGIVDIETLKLTQENLVSTIEETLKIQSEGSQKRKSAEAELVTMEKELKERLLQLKDEYRY